MDFQEGYPTWRPDHHSLPLISYSRRSLRSPNSCSCQWPLHYLEGVDGRMTSHVLLFFTWHKELSIANGIVHSSLKRFILLCFLVMNHDPWLNPVTTTSSNYPSLPSFSLPPQNNIKTKRGAFLKWKNAGWTTKKTVIQKNVEDINKINRALDRKGSTPYWYFFIWFLHTKTLWLTPSFTPRTHPKKIQTSEQAPREKDGRREPIRREVDA